VITTSKIYNPLVVNTEHSLVRSCWTQST